MKGITPRKAITIIVLLFVGASLFIWIQGYIEETALDESVDGFTFAIEFSPDGPQRAMRFIIALFLGAVAFWSRRGAKIAVIVGLGVFVVIEFLTWFVMRSGAFDRTELEYHILSATLLAIALVLWIRGTHDLIIAILAPGYIVIESILWYVHTVRMREHLGVEQLYPPTTLNNIFADASEWHIAVMVVALVMILLGIWMARNTRPTEAPLASQP